MAKQSKQEQEWQAEADASALARANEITADQKRHEAAKKSAAKMAEDARKRAISIEKVAGSKVPAKTPKKAVSKLASAITTRAPGARAKKSTPKR